MVNSPERCKLYINHLPAMSVQQDNSEWHTASPLGGIKTRAQLFARAANSFPLWLARINHTSHNTTGNKRNGYLLNRFIKQRQYLRYLQKSYFTCLSKLIIEKEKLYPRDGITFFFLEYCARLQKAINKYYCSIYKCIYDDTE